MKTLLLLSLLSVYAVAGPTPPPKTIDINGGAKLATFDIESGKVEYMKGVEPDQVVRALLQELAAVAQQLEACRKPAAAPAPKKLK